MWYGKMTNKKIAIIGASYLQEPLISKAKEMGIETHVFAWQVGDVGRKNCRTIFIPSVLWKKKKYYRNVKKYTWTVFAQ